MRTRWALFLSGRGSTAQALLDQSGDLGIELVVSSRKKAGGVFRARRAGVPVLPFSKESSWDSLHQELRKRKINRIMLVGFMRLLPADFVAKWVGQIWNIHPSLLPAFAGADAFQKSFESKGPMGVTLHDVTAEMDAGPRRLRKKIERIENLEAMELRLAVNEQRLLREWAGRISDLRGISR